MNVDSAKFTDDWSKMSSEMQTTPSNGEVSETGSSNETDVINKQAGQSDTTSATEKMARDKDHRQSKNNNLGRSRTSRETQTITNSKIIYERKQGVQTLIKRTINY